MFWFGNHGFNSTPIPFAFGVCLVVRGIARGRMEKIGWGGFSILLLVASAVFLAALMISCIVFYQWSTGADGNH